jgi:hypothetical protein
MGRVMPNYRAYLLDEQGHILKAHDIVADADEAALKHASQYVDGHDVEVWQDKRVVATLKHNGG